MKIIHLIIFNLNLEILLSMKHNLLYSFKPIKRKYPYYENFKSYPKCMKKYYKFSDEDIEIETLIKNMNICEKDNTLINKGLFQENQVILNDSYYSTINIYPNNQTFSYDDYTVTEENNLNYILENIPSIKYKKEKTKIKSIIISKNENNNKYIENSDKNKREKNEEYNNNENNNNNPDNNIEINNNNIKFKKYTNEELYPLVLNNLNINPPKS